jgi:hypothetical protein
MLALNSLKKGACVMERPIITALWLVACFAAQCFAGQFYGKLDAGYGTLTEPDITAPGVVKGGVTAVFQGLFGENKLKYGAEFGMMEVYTSRDKDRLNMDQSLILLPFLGALQYDFDGGKTVSYVGASAGPYFAIEHENNSIGGANGSSSGSKVYGGGCLWGGVRTSVSTKIDVNLSLRYSRIKASEDVSMIGIYAGIGANMPFFAEKKSDKIVMPGEGRK